MCSLWCFVKLKGAKGGCERADQRLICCCPKLSWRGESHDVSSSRECLLWFEILKGPCNMRTLYDCWALWSRKEKEALWRARSSWSRSSWGRAACWSTWGRGAGSMSPRKIRLALPLTLPVVWPTLRAGDFASRNTHWPICHLSVLFGEKTNLSS